MIVNSGLLAAVAAALGLGAIGCAHKAPPRAVTVNLQDDRPTCDDPFVRGFYDLTRLAFADGPANVDIPSFEQKAFAHFRTIAVLRGMDPEKMIGHLKGIPLQVIQIVKDDPNVLASCGNFNIALTGPP